METFFAFEELSLIFGGARYGSFDGTALIYFDGDEVIVEEIEVSPFSGAAENWKVDPHSDLFAGLATALHVDQADGMSAALDIDEASPDDEHRFSHREYGLGGTL